MSRQIFFLDVLSFSLVLHFSLLLDMTFLWEINTVFTRTESAPCMLTTQDQSLQSSPFALLTG